ncbi:MAG: tRNA pseudouridine(38-40) synthase TruA [Rhodospirillales bacterium]|jgi:tRNA pseudouridine38-40 synthase|nr:tRNA pseudouridine(38-40) synthase TruA [Rhodospirillales bacterium]MDP6803852.1 tRNA pseudouridine(38-40) synthase TruA [Rhodospirillales bacterium]
MARYRITVEYDGTDFVGWQRQTNGFSVQEAIEDAVRAFSGERVTVFGSGRTDSGVHALGQVAHFDLAREVPTDTVRDALNFHLKPSAVGVLSAVRVDHSFHARFSAIARTYLYRIVNRRAPLTLERGRAWWVPVLLDANAMDRAARVLVGRHDFTSFRASVCQAASPIRTLDELGVERAGDELRVRARARSFLHHQIRNVTGTLRLVGEGRWTGDDVAAALRAHDRAAAGPTAPACGLYLESVGYGDSEAARTETGAGEGHASAPAP